MSRILYVTGAYGSKLVSLLVKWDHKITKNNFNSFKNAVHQEAEKIILRSMLSEEFNIVSWQELEV